MFFSWRKFGVVEALGGGGYRQDSEPVGESFLDGQGSDLLLPVGSFGDLSSPPPFDASKGGDGVGPKGADEASPRGGAGP